jgi:hypothetical protein
VQCAHFLPKPRIRMPEIVFRCFFGPNFLGVTLVYRFIEPLEEGGSVRDAQILLLVHISYRHGSMAGQECRNIHRNHWHTKRIIVTTVASAFPAFVSHLKYFADTTQELMMPTTSKGTSKPKRARSCSNV